MEHQEEGVDVIDGAFDSLAIGDEKAGTDSGQAQCAQGLPPLGRILSSAVITRLAPKMRFLVAVHQEFCVPVSARRTAAEADNARGRPQGMTTSHLDLDSGAALVGRSSRRCRRCQVVIRVRPLWSQTWPAEESAPIWMFQVERVALSRCGAIVHRPCTSRYARYGSNASPGFSFSGVSSWSGG